MDKEVVKELIQSELKTENLVKELRSIISGEKRNIVLKEYEILRKKLGGEGASDHAADIIINSF